MSVEPLLPSGYFEFERDKTIKRYEDDYVICERHEDGSVTMTGKPLRPVFIYAEDSESR